MQSLRLGLPLLAVLLILRPAVASAQECVFVLNQLFASINAVDRALQQLVYDIPISEIASDCPLNPPTCQLTAMVLNAGVTRAYVARQGAPGTVYVVDVTTKTLVTQVTVGGSPSALVMNRDGSRVYVANLASDNVSVIDTGSNQVVDTIDVGDGPLALALTPDGASLLVVNSNEDTVSVVRTADGVVVDTIEVGMKPAGIAVAHNGARAYVTNRNGNSVTPIDLPSGQPGTEIAVGNQPRDVVFAPNDATAFVTNVLAGTVSVIDTSAGSTTGGPITVGDGPVALALSDDGSTLYVVNLASASISIVDTATRGVDSVAVVAPFDVTLGDCPVGAATPTPEGPACVGDCGGDGTVAVNEMIQGVNIALGNAAATTCPSFDVNGDGQVAVNELIAAVNNLLNSCPP